VSDRFDGNGLGASGGFGDVWGVVRVGEPEDETPPEQYLELIGTHLRAGGVAVMGRFRRVSDYVNLLDGFFALRDVVLLTRTGESTRITMPELRVRLDDVAIVGSLSADVVAPSKEVGVYVQKVPRRLVVMTRAHIVYGNVYIHEHGSVMQFVDSADPKFIPMTNVRVRWLADRRLAARYPFAMIQRSQIQGVATEGTGAPREARAKRKAAVALAEAFLQREADNATPTEVG